MKHIAETRRVGLKAFLPFYLMMMMMMMMMWMSVVMMGSQRRLFGGFSDAILPRALVGNDPLLDRDSNKLNWGRHKSSTFVFTHHSSLQNQIPQGPFSAAGRALALPERALALPDASARRKWTEGKRKGGGHQGRVEWSRCTRKSGSV